MDLLIWLVAIATYFSIGAIMIVLTMINNEGGRILGIIVGDPIHLSLLLAWVVWPFVMVWCAVIYLRERSYS